LARQGALKGRKDSQFVYESVNARKGRAAAGICFVAAPRRCTASLRRGALQMPPGACNDVFRTERNSRNCQTLESSAEPEVYHTLNYEYQITDNNNAREQRFSIRHSSFVIHHAFTRNRSYKNSDSSVSSLASTS